ncbi:MAG: hypothetical protein K5863_22220 [Nitratireductor sp.]|uniref:hypothetical protein n=1 Tax=Nitratireductor sp. TaxID=1872084 RepID=UPI0026193A11|nr:hypothetical protein [Nitratireductor sp.]MCV0352801.1 hypothetical protein [Nitratireductor sp.]
MRPPSPSSGFHVDPSRPVADGIRFDDLDGLEGPERNLLAARGVVFCSEFQANDRTYGGCIIGTSWPHAEEIAFGRGLGEEVIGVLVKAGSVDLGG